MKESTTLAVARQLEKQDSQKPLELRVKVRTLRKCPRCGHQGLHRHQLMPRRRVLHMFVAGRWVYLSWTPIRFRCPECGKTVTCGAEGVRRWARLSDEAVETLVRYSRRMNYGSVAELLELERQRVRRVLMKRVGTQILPEIGEPVVLTLDELSFRQQDYMCAVGELAPTKRILTLLENDLGRTIEGYLRALKNSGVIVEAFVIDMKDAWRKLVKRVFPEAKVIVDPFHVIQDANRRVDQARLIEQEASGYSISKYVLVKPKEKLTPKQAKELEWVRRKFPALHEIHLLKEDLRKVVRLQNESEVRQELSRWLINADSAANAEGRVWANTVRNWREELQNLAYYTGQGRRYTNGYIEGKITLVKMVKRLGFGFRNRESFLKKAFVGCCPKEQIPQLLT
jgi:transposase